MKFTVLFTLLAIIIGTAYAQGGIFGSFARALGIGVGKGSEDVGKGVGEAS